MRKMFKKAVSLAVALTLIIAVLPAMGTAFAAEIGETTFEFSNKKINGRENDNALNDAKTEITLTALENMTSYVELGSVSVDSSYYRDWCFFKKYINNNSSGSGGITAQHGIYYDIGSDGRLTSWFALKVKGVASGTYNIKMQKDNKTTKGCIWSLYILDNDFSDASVTDINTALNNLSDGVQKVGSVDLYGSADSELEFGNVSLSDETKEYIVLFRAEKAGALDGKETSSAATSRTYFCIKSLSFTPTAPAKNANVFGDKAAFIENTDNGESWLYLVSALDSLVYDEAGFDISIDGAESQTVKTGDVYSTLIVDGQSYFTPEDFGLTSSNYLYLTKTLLTGFTGQTVNFKPYAVRNGAKISGSTYQVTLKTN